MSLNLKHKTLMIQWFTAIASVLIYSCNTTAQINKKPVDTCGIGFYWFEGNSEKVNKDSIAITAYIKIVDTEINPPAPFSSVYFNEKRVYADKQGKVYIKLPKGEYIIRAFRGGKYPITSEKFNFLGGHGATIIFYFKAQLIVD